jgi:hypothetical protein
LQRNSKTVSKEALYGVKARTILLDEFAIQQAEDAGMDRYDKPLTIPAVVQAGRTSLG